MRIAVLSSNNLDLLKKDFKNKLTEENIESKFYFSGFNQYSQDILDENSDLYSFNPEIIILNIDLNDLVEKYVYDSVSESYKERKETYNKRYNEVKNLIMKLMNNLPESLILFNNFYYPPINNNSLFNYNSEYGNLKLLNKLNNKLTKLANDYINFQVVDFRGLIMQVGYEDMFDRRTWYLGKIKLSNKGLERLAELYLRYIKAYLGKRKKCIVVDLDNTLWGGIIGEDGIEDIKLGKSGIGQAFYDFQKVLLGLYNRGIILAINSKNTKEIALNAIKQHPHMLLQEDHFAVKKINWNNKARNMREIAQNLNIGLDSMVFLDDSDFERELIREQVPEVTVPELPEDFSDYPEFLMSLSYFDFVNLTFTDKNRNKMYKDNEKRKELKNNTSNDIEEYYYSLDMEVNIDRLDDFALPRVTQLTQKTNQFNLTTKRYKANDIERMKESEKYLVYYLELKDKFGSTGIVAVSIIELLKDKKALIDSFILSCRVMGRTVETAFLSYIVDELSDQGIEIVYGDYFPTAKNQPVKDFYDEHGFEQISENRWKLELEKSELEIPDWIEVEEGR